MEKPDIEADKAWIEKEVREIIRDTIKWDKVPEFLDKLDQDENKS